MCVSIRFRIGLGLGLGYGYGFEANRIGRFGFEAKSDSESRQRSEIGNRGKIGFEQNRTRTRLRLLARGLGILPLQLPRGRSAGFACGGLRALRFVFCVLCFAFAFAFAVRVGGREGGEGGREGGGRREGAALPFAAAGRGGPRLASSRGGRVCGCYVAVAPYGSYHLHVCILIVVCILLSSSTKY